MIERPDSAGEEQVDNWRRFRNEEPNLENRKHENGFFLCDPKYSSFQENIIWFCAVSCPVSSPGKRRELF